MGIVNFTKATGSGNDFIIIEMDAADSKLKNLARNICDRKFGIGADGLLVLEKSKKADIRMRVINSDGSEAKMCGNGARCVAAYLSRRPSANSRKILIDTKAGLIESAVTADSVKIKLPPPAKPKMNIPLEIGGRRIRVNFINTGVPHVVVFVQGIDALDVAALGRQIRHHPRFAPDGTNVNFAQVLNSDSIRLRTFERGVEGETLSCGTGAVAAALIFSLAAAKAQRVNVRNSTGDVLKVYFKRQNNGFSDVWLEGEVRIVAKGIYYV